MVSKDIINDSAEKYRLFGIAVLIEDRCKGYNYQDDKRSGKAVVEFVENTFVTSTKIVIKWVKEHLEKITQETEIKVKVTYLPAYSPNLNLIERLWKYPKKKLLWVYYEEKWKFKTAVKEFFENIIKNKVEKLVLKQSIGTSFQIISG